MLDRTKLAQELERLVESLFKNTQESSLFARIAWEKLCSDTAFAHRVSLLDDQSTGFIPWWYFQKLDAVIFVEKQCPTYSVLSVDGSQIYSDRHQGVSCFLINIGSVLFSYGTVQYPVQLRSTPYVFTGNDTTHAESELCPEFVNCRRHELELRDGLRLCQQTGQREDNLLVLVDGSLIFWHLEGMGLKDRFLQVYLLLLLQYQQANRPIVGYISSPKSKELVAILRLWLSDCDLNQVASYAMINHLVDATIVNFFLPPLHRTILFQNRSKISRLYPADLSPYFFYIHTGVEIGRVELPAWVAHNRQLVDFIASLILDQCIKGFGYPIALAEAHEQAVVKGPDREFFYHLIQKMSIEYNKQIRTSFKSQRKTRIGF